MSKITKEKLLKTIDEITAKMPSTITFTMFSIRRSKYFDDYWSEWTTLYKTNGSIFKPLTKFRYKFDEINDFFEDLFKLLLQHLPRDIQIISDVAKKHGLYVELSKPINVTVPKSEILPLLDKLKEKVLSSNSSN